MFMNCFQIRVGVYGSFLDKRDEFWNIVRIVAEKKVKVWFEKLENLEYLSKIKFRKNSFEEFVKYDGMWVTLHKMSWECHKKF